MDQSSADRDPVERLAEEFLERHRRGEHPPLTEYVDRLPERAEEIRELFPALVMMEQLKPAAGDVTGSFINGGRAQTGRIPERLGDFRILREVGRGGMGIVFEAEQESLGRHVALKVLPSHALLNPRHLQRFLREARAAARLHHTNIVPVFGVGEGDGLHYYVMQFIAGSGLHEVIDELKRLKSPSRPTAEVGPGPGPLPSVREVARGLLTGHFAAATVEATTEAGPPNGQAVADPSGSFAKDLYSGTSILSGTGRDYAKAIARVGLQVAEALGYAHGQGVMHRDIKPSNLLIDVQGTVWVADFGLAKAMADTDGLTGEGDVLGTLRYMAPERFRGESDARSDLYALGLTLYELLTLRPAFDQADRDQLIHQVTTGIPPWPRTLNPEVPRDLETIVLKAIEPEPARRYQDAEELGEDLERFLSDRPIRARPVGAFERAAKWARRKPAVATLLALFTLSVVVGFIGVTWQWRQAVAGWQAATNNAAKARANFRHALATVDTFCTQVSEDELLEQPGMRPLRRRLLERAKQYYQEFQRDHGDDPTLMRELAQSFIRTGRIAYELGDVTAAHIALVRAKDTLIELLRSDPSDRPLRVLLARCLFEIEEVNNQLENMVIRVDIYDLRQTRLHSAADVNSYSVLETLVATDPGNLEYRTLLGRCYALFGVRQFQVSHYSRSEDLLRKAIETLEGARQAAPRDPEAARWLALAYGDLGSLYGATGRHTDSLKAFGQALDLLAGSEGRGRASRRRRLEQAQCLVKQGMALIELGRYRDGSGRLIKSDARLREIIQEDPEAVDSRHCLAVADRGLGRAALAGGRSAEARQRLRESLDIHQRLSDEARSSRDTLALAQSFLWLGRAEFQAGRLDAVPPLCDRTLSIVKDFEERLLIGTLVSAHVREVAQIRADVEALRASAATTGPAGRIAARRREVQALQDVANRQQGNPDRRFEVGWGLVHLAESLAQGGEFTEARSTLDRAFPPFKALVEDEPENLRWRHALARAWESLARVQAQAGQGAEARDSAEKAVALARELDRADPTYAYDLACMLCLSGTVSSSKGDEDEAVAALRRAIKAGFENGHLLRTDPRLDGLRSRPDFPASTGKSA